MRTAASSVGACWRHQHQALQIFDWATPEVEWSTTLSFPRATAVQERLTRRGWADGAPAVSTLTAAVAVGQLLLLLTLHSVSFGRLGRTRQCDLVNSRSKTKPTTQRLRRRRHWIHIVDAHTITFNKTVRTMEKKKKGIHAYKLPLTVETADLSGSSCQYSAIQTGEQHGIGSDSGCTWATGFNYRLYPLAIRTMERALTRLISCSSLRSSCSPFRDTFASSSSSLPFPIFSPV